jgi:hypothetical protein
MSLSACNPDRGPEYTTPAEFGEVTVSPQIMAFDSEVRVKVSVSCPYGLRNVCILYMLDGDESDEDRREDRAASRRHLVRLRGSHSPAESRPESDFPDTCHHGIQCALLYAASGIYGSRRRGGRIRTTHLNNEIAILWN